MLYKNVRCIASALHGHSEPRANKKLRTQSCHVVSSMAAHPVAIALAHLAVQHSDLARNIRNLTAPIIVIIVIIIIVANCLVLILLSHCA